MVTAALHMSVARPSLTVKSTLNMPVPLKLTVGIGPVAMPPAHGPVQVKSSGSPSGSEEPLPSSVTGV